MTVSEHHNPKWSLPREQGLGQRCWLLSEDSNGSKLSSHSHLVKASGDWQAGVGTRIEQGSVDVRVRKPGLRGL